MREIINSLGKHKTSGNEIIFATCPFCSGGQNKDKYTFSINERSGLYFCQRGKCNVKGNLQQLGKKLNIRVSDNRFITTERSFKLPTKKVNPAKKDLYEYFNKRGISEDTVDFAEIKQDGQNMVYDYYDEQGKLTFRKFKSFVGKKISREKDTKPIFYMMNKVNNESDTLIITEGEEDCLSLYEIGYDFAASLPSGSSDISCLSHNWNWLQTFKTFIIWTDDDEAGYKAEKEIIKRLGKSRCKVVKHKKKDINETLMMLGRQAIVNIVEDADFLPISKVSGVYDYDIFEVKEEDHIPSAFGIVNRCTEGGYRRGEVIVWTGHRFTGKSTMLQQDVATFIKSGEKVCIYSAEMINPRILKSFYRQCSGSDNVEEHKSKYYDGTYFMPTKPNVDKMNKWLYNNLFLISDDFDSYEDDLFDIFEQLIYQKGVSIFVIDNLMTVVKQDANINHNQSEFFKKCERFVKKHRAIIHLVSHQRKLSEDNIRKFRPTLAGIAGTSNIGNATDICIGVARISNKMKDIMETKKNKDNENELQTPKYNYDGELIILKERVSGVEGEMDKMFFDKKSLRFVSNWNDVNYKLGWEEL